MLIGSLNQHVHLVLDVTDVLVRLLEDGQCSEYRFLDRSGTTYLLILTKLQAAQASGHDVNRAGGRARRRGKYHVVSTMGRDVRAITLGQAYIGEVAGAGRSLGWKAEAGITRNAGITDVANLKRCLVVIRVGRLKGATLCSALAFAKGSWRVWVLDLGGLRFLVAGLPDRSGRWCFDYARRLAARLGDQLGAALVAPVGRRR